MAGSALEPRTIRFGLFELDLDARELRKSGVKIKLQEQPFQILTALLERPGEIVTREELHKRLWPDDTFVDFDLSLNSAVKKLRQALGDDSDNPRFVETLYRRGYRFIGPVNGSVRADTVPPEGPMLVPATDRQAHEPTGQAKPPMRGRRILLYIVGAAAITLAAEVAFWFAPTQPPRVLGYTQITHDSRAKGIGVTDGERIYFNEADGDHWVIAQVAAGGGETSILATPSWAFAGLSDIAPDGSALIVASFMGTKYDVPLWALPLPAGSPRRLQDPQSTNSPSGQSATWSPDGNTLLFARESEIFAANKDGSGVHKLATARGLVFNLRFAPDGRRVRFDVSDAKSGSTSIYEMKRDGNGVHEVLPGWNPAPRECCGRWTPDGRYFVFESFRQGAHNLWALPEKHTLLGRKPDPVQLTNGPLNYHGALPSKDGKKIFTVGSQARVELLRSDGKSGFLAYFAGNSASELAFSPDGKWVAYVTIPDRTLWRSRVNGSEPLQLTSTALQAALPRWSPDGKQIVFMGRSANTNWRAYLTSPGAGDLHELIPGGDYGFDPAFSPDGKNVILGAYYTGSGISILDLQRRRLTPLPDGDKYFSPRWSPDGKYIAAITLDSQKLMLFDVAAKTWSELTTMPIGYPSWSHDGKYLYFDTTLTTDSAFFRIRMADRKLERLLSLEGIRRFQGEFGPWTGLGPDDSLLVARFAGTEEIYALDWNAP
jgi:Tol biopolymer transport system component/DNA-binding winged helix-turn-helix (wHTH) protein